MACWGTTPFPRALAMAFLVSPGVQVTQPFGSPIIHSVKTGVSRPRVSVGQGAGRPRMASHRRIAGS